MRPSSAGIEPDFEAGLAALGGCGDFHRKPAQRHGGAGRCRGGELRRGGWRASKRPVAASGSRRRPAGRCRPIGSSSGPASAPARCALTPAWAAGGVIELPDVSAFAASAMPFSDFGFACGFGRGCDGGNDGVRIGGRGRRSTGGRGRAVLIGGRRGAPSFLATSRLLSWAAAFAAAGVAATAEAAVATAAVTVAVGSCCLRGDGLADVGLAR